MNPTLRCKAQKNSPMPHVLRYGRVDMYLKNFENKLSHLRQKTILLHATKRKNPQSCLDGLALATNHKHFYRLHQQRRYK